MGLRDTRQLCVHYKSRLIEICIWSLEGLTGDKAAQLQAAVKKHGLWHHDAGTASGR